MSRFTSLETTSALEKPIGNLAVNWNNSLSRGLVGCVPFNGNVVDLCNNYAYDETYADYRRSLKIETRDKGYGHTHISTDGYRLNYKETINTGSVFIYYQQLNQDNFDNSFGYASPGSTRITVRHFTAEMKLEESGGALPAGSFYTLPNSVISVLKFGITLDNGTSQNFYNDDTKTDISGLVGNTDHGLERLTFGLAYNNHTAVDSTTCIYYVAYVWDRILSDSEFLSLHARPYQLLKSDSLMLYQTSAGGGAGGNLSLLQDSNLGVTLFNGIIS